MIEKMLIKKIQEYIKNLQPRKYNLLRQQGSFMFRKPHKFSMEEQKEGKNTQEHLLELMYMHQAYHDVLSRKLESQYTLRGSIIKCSYGFKAARLDCVRDHGVLLGSRPVLTCRDCNISNIHNFDSCMCPEFLYMNKKINNKSLPMTAAVRPNGKPAMKAWGNRYAHICVPLIGGEWLQEDADLMIEDYNTAVQALVDSAVLTCQYGGFITILEVPEKKEPEDEYRKYLQQKGFPDEYIDHLLPLHEIYPEWEFEAVQTGVDFEEFVDFQYENKYKCTDNKNESDGKVYKGEKSGKYDEVKRSVIHQYANPYNILRSDEAGYVPAMQFLKAEQIIPKKYSDEVVYEILKSRYNEDFINKVQNMNISINPVFLAAVMKAENGPYNEEYNGKYIYNMFNFGATSGRIAGKQYAYDHEWFTEDACLDACEELFGKYLDRGQNTLYALDWHFKAYADRTRLYQYATLVRDSEDKSHVLGNRGEEVMHYNFVFSIPIYENISTN